MLFDIENCPVCNEKLVSGWGVDEESYSSFWHCDNTEHYYITYHLNDDGHIFENIIEHPDGHLIFIRPGIDGIKTKHRTAILLYKHVNGQHYDHEEVFACDYIMDSKEAINKMDTLLKYRVF